MTDAAPDPSVVIPAGRPIAEAGGWVGAACWAELRLFEVLSAWLAAEADPERTVALWRARADAAERAEAWHRRLPELREMPRAGFVVPASDAAVVAFDDLADLVDPEDGGTRAGALAAVLGALRSGYRAHLAVAVGPADGPVADTLAEVLRSPALGADATADAAEPWTTRLAEAALLG